MDQTTLTGSRKKSAAVFNQRKFRVHAANKIRLISGFPWRARWSWKLHKCSYLHAAVSEDDGYGKISMSNGVKLCAACGPSLKGCWTLDLPYASASIDALFSHPSRCKRTSSSVWALTYLRSASVGCREMEWEYTCHACDLRDCVSFVALMKGLLVCRWYQPRSRSRPLKRRFQS